MASFCRLVIAVLLAATAAGCTKWDGLSLAETKLSADALDVKLEFTSAFATDVHAAARAALHPLSRFVESEPDPRIDPRGNSPY